jgi:hypothetical protein
MLAKNQNEAYQFDTENESENDSLTTKRQVPVEEIKFDYNPEVLSSNITTLNKVISEIEVNPLKLLKKSDSPLSISIIPNVNRIRIEKR